MKKGLNNIVLIQFLFFSLAAVTAVQKITGPIVPEWFLKKFEATPIGSLPYGVEISYLIIIVLESLTAICFLVSIIKMEFLTKSGKIFLLWGFDLSMLLFSILFFGSFLAGDYNNGALDFMYFGITYFLKKDLLKAVN